MGTSSQPGEAHRAKGETAAKSGASIGAALTVLSLLALDVLLPTRYRLAPQWAPYVAAGMLAGPMVTSWLARATSWRRAGRIAMMTTLVVLLVVDLLNLVKVVDAMLFHPHEVRPMPLLASAAMIWVSNTLVFALLYWAVDRGGPAARANDVQAYPDFDFPAYANPSRARPGWRTTFIDYLFLAFTTSTAFSPTEAMPITPLAKSLMIFQSSISLMTIAVVAARAIGTVP